MKNTSISMDWAVTGAIRTRRAMPVSASVLESVSPKSSLLKGAT
jgi:hypothetical protein